MQEACIGESTWEVPCELVRVWGVCKRCCAGQSGWKEGAVNVGEMYEGVLGWDKQKGYWKVCRWGRLFHIDFLGMLQIVIICLQGPMSTGRKCKQVVKHPDCNHVIGRVFGGLKLQGMIIAIIQWALVFWNGADHGCVWCVISRTGHKFVWAPHYVKTVFQFILFETIELDSILQNSTMMPVTWSLLNSTIGSKPKIYRTRLTRAL